MMHRNTHIAFWVGLLLCLATNAGAQQAVSLQLDNVLLPLKQRADIPQKSSAFRMNGSSLPLHIGYDAEGRVKHVGVSIFSDEEKKAIGQMLCDFHERFLLSVLLEENDSKAHEMLKRNNAEIITSGISFDKQLKRSTLEQALARVISEKPRFVSARDSRQWNTAWQGEAFSLSLSFPVDIQLITGMDKKELGTAFCQQLNEMPEVKFQPSPLFLDVESATQVRKNMFKSAGESYLTDAINSSIYFEKGIGTEPYIAVFDAKYPEESTKNLFLSPNHQAGKLQISIRQKGYDNMPEYTVVLSKLLTFVQDEHETFVGIEQCSQKKLNFTVIFKSKGHAYHHLLFVETTPDILFKADRPLNATLYTYIPTGNVKDLYYNQWETEKKE